MNTRISDYVARKLADDRINGHDSSPINSDLLPTESNVYKNLCFKFERGEVVQLETLCLLLGMTKQQFLTVACRDAMSSVIRQMRAEPDYNVDAFLESSLEREGFQCHPTEYGDPENPDFVVEVWSDGTAFGPEIVKDDD